MIDMARYLFHLLVRDDLTAVLRDELALDLRTSARTSARRSQASLRLCCTSLLICPKGGAHAPGRAWRRSLRRTAVLLRRRGWHKRGDGGSMTSRFDSPRFLIVPVSYTAMGMASRPRLEISGSSVVGVCARAALITTRTEAVAEIPLRFYSFLVFGSDHGECRRSGSGAVPL
jgi:hypothetical protein